MNIKLLLSLLAGVAVAAAVAVLLFASDGNGSGEARIAFVEPDGSAKIKIRFAAIGRDDIGFPTQNTLAVQCPAWSPDGSRVAYIGFGTAMEAEPQLFVASANGSNPKAIT